ncbi:hypothetical protein [Marinobacter adhaerens]|uniref:hypothetical protein n=1 Tax=Marinobacter adhaerens TaxID=1033846 RepID=UPI001C56B5E5|nr:hypothetical protein [Marinobacter adhaerens]MBW3226014.1 hypothetical protein [Marinobacter adhaerens]
MSVHGFFLKKVILIIILSLLILNPYTIFGALAFALLPIVFVSFFKRFRGLGFDTLLIILGLILISAVGVFSSFFHDIGQFVHLKVSMSIAVYIFISHGLFFLFLKGGFEFNDFVHCLLLVVSLNSLVIVSQVYFPLFRQIIENFLVLSGNIDWTEGFRYRGIASGGGASLSVLVPVSAVLALYLYSERYLSFISMMVHLFVLIFSVFFIGRTGLVLLPIVALFFIFFNARKYLFRTTAGLVLGLGLFFALSGVIKKALIEQYGIGFYNYAVGFLLPGGEGLKGEGTVSTIMQFLSVLPTTFPEVIFGYGFYGGSEFEPWTDSGYSRMFLSVGYIFGLLFYILFFLMFRNVLFYKPFLFLTIGALLLVAEIKEPLLFTGYSARLYIVILVVGLLSKRWKCYADQPRYAPLNRVPSSKGVL